jgi:hypothetical protein
MPVRFLVLTLLVAACGGSTETPTATDAGTDSATAAGNQEKMICDALASRSACPDGALTCEEDAKCIYGRVMLPAAASAYASCRGAPSCKGDDECVANAGRAVGGAAADKYATDCLARLKACPDSFRDDYCTPGVFAYPGSGPGAVECIAKPCDQIFKCFDSLQAIKDIAACK